MSPVVETGARIRRFVTSDGTPLHVELSGFAEAPQTMVLVHGWTQDHRTWDRVLAELPSGVRRLRYDLRGHGASGPAAPGTATIDQLADDLAELIGELAGDGRLVLAGHSMGGMTIMALADRYPRLVSERVDGVALVSTACGDMNRTTLGLPGVVGNGAAGVERKLAALLASYRGERFPLPPAVARVGARWLLFGHAPRRPDVTSVADQLLCAHPASVGAFRNDIALHDRRAALETLRETPGVVLAGTADRLCSVQHARAIAGELEAGQLVLFPHAGHMLPQERAHDVALHLGSLLSAREPAGQRW